MIRGMNTGEINRSSGISNSNEINTGGMNRSSRISRFN